MQGNVAISVGTPLKCYLNFLKNLHKLCKLAFKIADFVQKIEQIQIFDNFII